MKDESRELRALQESYQPIPDALQRLTAYRRRRDRRQRVGAIVVAVIVLALGAIPIGRMFSPPESGRRVVPGVEAGTGAEPTGKIAYLFTKDGVEHLGIADSSARTLSSRGFPGMADLWPSGWFPDGRSLLMSSDRGIFRLRGDLTGDPELIVPYGVQGVVSPDGSKLLYSIDQWVPSAKRGVFVLSLDPKADGAEPVLVWPDERVQELGWFADSRSFVFSSPNKIMKATLTADGDAIAVSLADDGGDPTAGPDGRVAYVFEDYIEGRGLVMELRIWSPSGISTLYSVDGLIESLSWSPDGNWIAFHSSSMPDDGTGGQSSVGPIQIVNVNSGEVRTVVPGNETEDAFCCNLPVWGPP